MYVNEERKLEENMALNIIVCVIIILVILTVLCVFHLDVKRSALGLLLWIAVLTTWIIIFQHFRAEWGEVGDYLSFTIPLGIPWDDFWCVFFSLFLFFLWHVFWKINDPLLWTKEFFFLKLQSFFFYYYLPDLWSLIHWWSNTSTEQSLISSKVNAVWTWKFVFHACLGIWESLLVLE